MEIIMDGGAMTNASGAMDAARSTTDLVALSGALDLRHAAEICELLQSALANQRTVCVDTTDLVEADISILQLLVAAQKTAMATDRGLEIVAPEGGALRRLAAAYGLALPLTGVGPHAISAPGAAA